MIIPALIQVVSSAEQKAVAPRVPVDLCEPSDARKSNLVCAEYLAVEGLDAAKFGSAAPARMPVHLMASWWLAPTSFDRGC